MAYCRGNYIIVVSSFLRQTDSVTAVSSTVDGRRTTRLTAVVHVYGGRQTTTFVSYSHRHLVIQTVT